MSRPPTIPAEKKIRIVLSVLQGEISIAEAARREKVSELSHPGVSGEQIPWKDLSHGTSQQISARAS